MFKQAGYSVLTQALSSAANFVVSIMMLRVLSLGDFGYYFFLYLCASFASAFTAAITGSVYPICRPRMGRATRGYEAGYNALNLLVIPANVALFAAGTLAFVAPPAGVGVGHVVAFVAALVLVDNIKLQAGANGSHRQILIIEAVRQASLIAGIIAFALSGTLSLAGLVSLHAGTGLASVAALLVVVGWRPSFRRLGWVVGRHVAHARHLVPANLISTLHSTAIQFAVTQQFGAAAVGLLRSAELPFSALNPLKLSLALFLPGAIYRLEQKPLAEKRRVLVRAAALIGFGAFAVGLLVWGGAALALPWLTGKPYPVWLGFVYAIANAVMIVLVVSNYYLTVLDGANLVLRQAVLGAVVAIGVYLAAAPTFAHLAAPASLIACFTAMTVYALVSLYHKAWLGVHGVRALRGGQTPGTAPETGGSAGDPRPAAAGGTLSAATGSQRP